VKYKKIKKIKTIFLRVYIKISTFVNRSSRKYYRWIYISFSNKLTAPDDIVVKDWLTVSHISLAKPDAFKTAFFVAFYENIFLQIGTFVCVAVAIDRPFFGQRCSPISKWVY